jgi:hypothetical protein
MGSTRIAYTGLRGELEHLKDKDEVNRRVVCECDGANLIRVLQAACLLIRVFEAACKKFLRQQVRISMTVLTSYLLPSISMKC